jgi:hypothetical protein
MFKDSEGKPTVGFCLWCNRDFYSAKDVEAHNASEMAACPVYQELHGEGYMPPILQLMLKDAGLQAEPSENNAEEGEVHVTAGKFDLGQVVATPGALTAMEESGKTPGEFLSRHASGDWGDLCDDDRKENELSLEHGFRLLSSYKLRTGTVIWIITEADRSSTTLLLPDESISHLTVVTSCSPAPEGRLQPMSTLAQKLHPCRFTAMSSRMAALVGHFLGESFTSPEIISLFVTSDKFILAMNAGEIGYDTFIGSVSDLKRNWDALLLAADLTSEERVEADRLFNCKIA